MNVERMIPHTRLCQRFLQHTDIRWPISFIYTHSFIRIELCTRIVANSVIIFANEDKKNPQQWNWIVRCGKSNNSALPTTISQQWCISNIDCAWSEWVWVCRMRMHFDAYLNPTKPSMFLSMQTHFVAYCTITELLSSINLVDRICWFADFIQIKRIWWVKIQFATTLLQQTATFKQINKQTNAARENMQRCMSLRILYAGSPFSRHYFID